MAEDGVPQPAGFAGTTTTEGAGPIVLGGSITGSTGMCTADIEILIYKIVAVDEAGAATGQWEIGHGRYLQGTKEVTREAPMASSASAAGVESVDPLEFAAGAKYVHIYLPSDYQ